MTTSNLNKIVRGNLNLKPWILSKNPRDIVNSCVQQLYKQVSENYKKDLRNPQIATVPRIENRSLIRFKFPIVNAPKQKARPGGYQAAQMATNKSFVAAPKKFLKSPNYKIYSSRKYGSSASSSGGSFFRNDFEERRKKMYKPANGIQFRTYTRAVTVAGENFYNNPGIAKYIAPTRVFNDLSDQTKCLEITNAICKDLMSVDAILKEKIRVNKVKSLAVDISDLSKQDIQVNSFKGWNHPTMAKLKKLQDTPPVKKPLSVKNDILERGLSTYNLMPGNRKSYGFQSNNSRQPPKHENARHQVVNYPPYTGAIPYNRTSEKLNNNQADPKRQSVRDPNDFVCRSRSERTAHTTRSSHRRCIKETTPNFRRF